MTALQLWDTRGLKLNLADSAFSVPGDEIIVGQFVYGACGTCQSADLSVLNPYYGLSRQALWKLRLETRLVFRGIIDTALNPGGKLGRVTLIGPHRQKVGGLGEAFTGLVYGIPASTTQAEAHQPLSSLLDSVMRPYPHADLGVRADGVWVMGLAEYAEFAEYTLDERAYDVTTLGADFPPYITDAVFDPGEGWKKYVYKRYAPDYTLRTSAAATADPTIVTKTDDTLAVTRDASVVPSRYEGDLVMSYFNNIGLDGVTRQFGDLNNGQFEVWTHVGLYSLTTPTDTDERRHTTLRLRVPYRVVNIRAAGNLPDMTYTPVVPTPGGDVAQASPINAGASGPEGSTLESVAAAVSANARVLNSAIGALNSAIEVMNGNGDLVEQMQVQVHDVREKLNDLGTKTQQLDGTLNTARDTPARGEITLTVQATVAGQPTEPVQAIINESRVGLELSLELKITGTALSAGAEVELRIELAAQDSGKIVTAVFNPLIARLDYDTPNVEGVKMPDGWTAPFKTPPRFEFKLPGWHTPPLKIHGLPGVGTQMAAGTTVIWNKNEASTLVTTAAWPYPSQQRGGG